MGAFRKLATLLFILAIPVAIITTNIRFLVNEPRVYEYAIDQYDAVSASGVDRDQLLQGAADMRAYFNDNQDTLQVRVQQNGQDVSLFNVRETAHLKDIKTWFKFIDRLQEFSVIFVISYIALVVLWAREVSLRALSVEVMAGCVVVLLVAGGVGAVSAAGFDSAWLKFHEIFFPGNDFWLLNPFTDHLIQMFPPQFMENMIFFAGLLMVSEAALLIIAGGIYLGVSSHQPETHRLAPTYA